MGQHCDLLPGLGLTLKRRKAASQQVRLCSSSLQNTRSPLWPLRSLLGWWERKWVSLRPALRRICLSVCLSVPAGDQSRTWDSPAAQGMGAGGKGGCPVPGGA